MDKVISEPDYVTMYVLITVAYRLGPFSNLKYCHERDLYKCFQENIFIFYPVLRRLNIFY
jgi:hypothetical protein